MLLVLFRPGEHRHIVPAQGVNLLQGPLQQAGGFYLFRRAFRHGDGISSRLHFLQQLRRRGALPLELRPHAAVLHRLVGVAARHHRDAQLAAQAIGALLRLLAVCGQVLAV